MIANAHGISHIQSINIIEPDFVIIKEVEVELLETYKYIGVVFNSALSWKENTNTTIKKHTLSYTV